MLRQPSMFERRAICNSGAFLGWGRERNGRTARACCWSSHKCVACCKRRSHCWAFRASAKIISARIWGLLGPSGIVIAPTGHHYVTGYPNLSPHGGSRHVPPVPQPDRLLEMGTTCWHPLMPLRANPTVVAFGSGFSRTTVPESRTITTPAHHKYASSIKQGKVSSLQAQQWLLP
jgi:hypothetical protein